MGGWCVWRFFKKKRSGKDGKGKDIPPDTEEDKDDLQALVANAEEDLNPDDKKDTEYLGKVQFELRYDFNTQTLIVKIIQATELPAMDMGGVSDPRQGVSSSRNKRTEKVRNKSTQENSPPS